MWNFHTHYSVIYVIPEALYIYSHFKGYIFISDGSMDDKNSIDGPGSPISQVINDVNDLMFDFNDVNDPSNNSSRRDSVGSPPEENTGAMLSRKSSLRSGLNLAVSNNSSRRDSVTSQENTGAMLSRKGSLRTGLNLAVSNNDFTTRRGSAPAIHFGHIGNTIDGLRSG